MIAFMVNFNDVSQGKVDDCLIPFTARGVKGISPRVPIHSCDDAARYVTTHVFAPFGDFLQEEFVVLLLDSNHRLCYEVALYRGTINSALVRIAEVFREAIRLNAFAILVAHNHPSGNPTPSQEDETLTNALQEAGDLLGITVLDHLVIGENRWISLRRRGVMGRLAEMPSVVMDGLGARFTLFSTDGVSEIEAARDETVREDD